MGQIHAPESMPTAQMARRRLAFDELLRLQLVLVMTKRAVERESLEPGPPGQAGTPLRRAPYTRRSVPRLVLNYDLRHPAPFGASAGATYAAALDQIAWADQHDFAFVAFGEHHQSADGYLSCPLVFAAAIVGRTEAIRVRVSTLLAPLYDPIRLAE